MDFRDFIIGTVGFVTGFSSCIALIASIVLWVGYMTQPPTPRLKVNEEMFDKVLDSVLRRAKVGEKEH